MRPRLFALPVCALVCATIDTLWTRSVAWHRPLDIALPLESFLIWSVFGILALIPVSLTSPLGRRFFVREGESSWSFEALSLLGWMLIPVAIHGVLDRHTGIYADLSALAGPRPWLEALGVFVLLELALFGLLKLLPRFRASRVALTTAALCFALLAIFPIRPQRFGESARAPEGAPNLLLLIWDTTRASSLASYGYDRETTPHLAELAERSVLYEEARSVAVYTLTSHVTMLTGTYPSHHRARLTRMQFSPRRTPSIARILRESGYRTGAFVGTGVLKASSGIVDGFETYDDLVDPAVTETRAWGLVHDVQSILAKLSPSLFNRHGSPHWIQDFQRSADEVLARATDWIEEEDDRPWFCMINMYDVHWPYLPNPEARERWVEEYSGDITGHLFRHNDYHLRDNGGVDGSLLTGIDNRHLEELYDAELWELDAKVAAFLERAGVDGGELGIVVTADHGEAFGEGGRYEHADVLEPQVRIPMLVLPPSANPHANLAGTRREGKASGVDVAKTLLGMSGLDLDATLELLYGPEAEVALSGVDLLAAPPDLTRAGLVEDRDQPNPRVVRICYYKDHWKLVRTGLGEDAKLTLFDLRSDPVGLTDLAADHPDLCLTLEAEMDALRATWGANDEEDAENTSIEDAGLLEGLGYIGKNRPEGE